jgi:TnpA family transposase
LRRGRLAVRPVGERRKAWKGLRGPPCANQETIQPLFGRRVRMDVIREHWDEVLRLVASLRAGTVLPSAMLKRLAAFHRQN